MRTRQRNDPSKTIEINLNNVSAYYNRAVTYYELKEYTKAWEDVHAVEGLGATVNPEFIKLLKEETGN